MNQTNTELNRIKEMLCNEDTVNDIYDKIIDKYPEIVEKKVVQFKGDKRRASGQVKAQISSVLCRHEGAAFTIDRTQHPYRYSFIDTGTETINMPDCSDIKSIMNDGASIGHSTSREIITWIGSNIQVLLNGERLEIERASTGWYVRIMRR